MKVIAPVRCPHCRSRLTSKLMPTLGGWIRWCRRCRCTVSYDPRVSNWFFISAVREDDCAPPTPAY